jgi:nucleoside-diphosphate-sugar epimerase
MKTLLITGLDGFTGRYLAKIAKWAGYRVVGTSHYPPENQLYEYELHVCDLVDTEAVASLIHLIQPDAVAHLAAISYVAYGDVEAIYRTNIIGTRNLINSLIALDKTPEAVLLASSANIYGNSNDLILDEYTAPLPANDYAVSKLAMEYMAKMYVAKLPINIVRPFNYTGVGQSSNYLLPKIVSHIREKAPVVELGNMNITRDFSDVRMVVAYYLKLLKNPQPSGSIFNVCSGKAYSLFEVLNLAQSISGHKLKTRVNSDYLRSDEVNVLVGSKIKLDAAVGEVATIPLEDTLRWMIEAP